MNTENQNENQKQPRKMPTEIEYHEKGHWTKGENIITVMGGLPSEPKLPIAFIKLLDYDENKKPILAALDLDGNELFERTSNLYQLKKLIREQEQRLTKEMIIHNAAPVKEVEQAASDSLTPVEEHPEKAKVNGLHKARRRKDSNDQSHEVSH